MSETPVARQIVLIGGGHTHLHIVNAWQKNPIPRTELTLVSPFDHSTYSGMLPGVLAGQYDDADMKIDLRRLTERCHVNLITSPMSGLDADASQVLFEDRPPLRYQIASIGIGSVPNGQEVCRKHPEVISIKPMQTFLDRLEDQLTEDSGHGDDAPALQVAIVGAGAAGFEVACCLDALLDSRAIDAELTLFDAGETILSGFRSQTVGYGMQVLTKKGIQVRTNHRVTDYVDEQLEFADGSRLSADLILWTVAAAPPPVLEQVQLPKADDGFLAVETTHQTTSGHPVFVVGDTATRVSNPIPKAGVFAVREGPVLWENLQRLSRKLPPLPYEPQSNYLRLLNTGDGQALMEWGPFSFHHRWMWKWKDAIDRRFIKEFQT
ncbi:FAD-dependent oxidoreductase [Thalassoroseus pseudoceratinae]|uniref:FAD-dependent oxidoreductase n=1 Tax=Thalassoroseus pseudoceratinae TaxID=2713176 RepID=UPI00141DE258|nr:FAD-dependent oxidoreductase [Thalassoroseus pseudoceratinae]